MSQVLTDFNNTESCILTATIGARGPRSIQHLHEDVWFAGSDSYRQVIIVNIALVTSATVCNHHALQAELPLTLEWFQMDPSVE